MLFYPISFSQGSALKAKRGYTTFVVHTNTMEEKDFERYEQMFEKYKDRLMSYAELFTVEPRFRGALGNMKEYLMAVAKSALVSLRA